MATESKECVKIVAEALEMGYEAVDTAQIYENEADVGEGIKVSGVDREKFILTSKVWRDQLSKENVIKSTEESLKKLKTDYLDLMLIHWPSQDHDLRDTFAGFEELKKSGKIKHFGVSNFPLHLLKEANEIDDSFVCNQVEYHPYLNQTPIIKWLVENEKFLIAYSPLARGKVLKDETLQEIAEKYKISTVQLTLAWLTSMKGVITIPKTTSKEHLKSNLDGLRIDLEDKDILAIDEMTKANDRMISPDFAPKWD